MEEKKNRISLRNKKIWVVGHTGMVAVALNWSLIFFLFQPEQESLDEVQHVITFFFAGLSQFSLFLKSILETLAAFPASLKLLFHCPSRIWIDLGGSG